MSVTLNGTSGLTFNDGSTQNTGATGFGFKNRLINGAFVIDQRNAGASVTGNNSVFPVDRWKVGASQSSKLTMQQNQNSVTPPVGFNTYLGITSSSAYSVTSSDEFEIIQYIEGFNTADLGWGTANASTLTLSFWARSSLTGTFGGSFSNDSGNRGYAFSYTINAANTWEYKTITVAGDTTGTWFKQTEKGITVLFSLGAGSSLLATAGSWGASFPRGVTGQVNLVGTNGATFYITGVQLEKGSTATSFDYRPYGTELALCQRYFEIIQLTGSINDRPFGVGGTFNSGAQVFSQPTVFFKVLKRADPTVTFTAASTFGQHSPGAYRNILTSISLNTATTTSLQINTISGNSGGSAGASGACMILEAANGQQPAIGISAEL